MTASLQILPEGRSVNAQNYYWVASREVAELFGLARLGEYVRRYRSGDQSFQPLISPPK